jgi:putative cell wall-binding protein
VPASARSGVIAVDSDRHHLVLKQDGSVVGWGLNHKGQAHIPPTAKAEVTAVAAGEDHSLALKQDGSVIGWGGNFSGQTNIPAEAKSGVIAVSAGSAFSLALKQNGSVIGWGVNSDNHHETTIPAEAQSGVVAISAGAAHSLALKQDGSVIAWGGNDLGQLDVPAAAKTGVTAIATNVHHSLALKQDGSVVAWGENAHGQITVPQAAQSDVTAIAAGVWHSLALKDDGSVISWGAHEDGLQNIPAGAQSEVVGIAAGSAVSFAIRPMVPPQLGGVAPAGKVGVAYEYGFEVSGAPKPTVSVKDAALLPPGLGVSAGGVLSGTPTQIGTFSFTLISENAAGRAELPITLQVTPLIDRVAGADRFQTSVEIARAGWPTGADVVFLASGETFPDALSAGPAAAKLDGPVLLTGKNTLPAVVEADLTRLHPSRVVVVGGVNAISNSVTQQLTQLGFAVERIAGPDRFATSRELAKYAFGADATRAFVTTGLDFPDALSAGAAIGATGPVLLVDGHAQTLDPEIAATLDGLNTQNTFIAGGLAAVNHHIEAALQRQGTTKRLAGPTRYETSQAINEQFFSGAQRALLATGVNFPDALSGTAWAPKESAPLYVIPTECVPGSVLARFAASTEHITLLGGPKALRPAIETLTPCE